MLHGLVTISSAALGLQRLPRLALPLKSLISITLCIPPLHLLSGRRAQRQHRLGPR